MKRGLLWPMMAVVIGTFVTENKGRIARDELGYPHITSVAEACKSSPLTLEAVKESSELAQREATKLIESISACPPEQRNKETVLYALDRVYAWIYSTTYSINVVGKVHPDEELRKECFLQTQVLLNFLTEHVSSNKVLYKVFVDYRDTVAPREDLTPEEHFFLKRLSTQFEWMGIALSEEKAVHLGELEKKIRTLNGQFNYNIQTDTTKLIFPKEEMAGVSQDFLGKLVLQEDKYVVPVNRPSLEALSCARAESTRKAIHVAFYNRAYPKNVEIVKELVAAHDERASLWEAKSYAALDLPTQSVGSEEAAWKFLDELQSNLVPVENKKLQEMMQDLPEGVSLTAEGKIKNWDVLYVTSHYLQKKFAIDKQKIAEYFPLESTITGLIKIYEQFLGIVIEMVPVQESWHEDVRLMRVRDKNHTVLGYIFLDMFFRERKFSHPIQLFSIDGIKKKDGTQYASVSVVLLPFAKPQEGKPTLLTHAEVVTFFHEFGHGIHTVFAKSSLYYHSGIKKIETDILEAPSQVLEEWLSDPKILQQLSRHYETGEHLPDATISNLLAYNQYEGFLPTPAPVQLYLSRFLLALFGPGQEKDIDALARKAQQESCPLVEFGDNDHRYCSQVHLGDASYRHRYYGYLWARALALAFFEKIKSEGLLNSEAGKRYIECVLSRGSSKEGLKMVVDYLGGEPRFDAFYRKMGL
jgi:Zn-dependent oligopeptidase